jgi:hypothetical protein
MEAQQTSGLASDTLTKQRDESATELVKALLIINGGGAVALLAFWQATWSSAPDLAKPTLVGNAVLSFGALSAASFHFFRHQNADGSTCMLVLISFILEICTGSAFVMNL